MILNGMIGEKVKSKLEKLHRKADSQLLPPRIVCLLTNPRSGSTWLFDALRCHPAIDMHPDRRIWKALGLHGRRYPRDLSQDLTEGIQVEVLPDQWVFIPHFYLDNEAELISDAQRQTPYAIEKLHPHFFDYKSRAFLNHLDALRPTSEVKMVYQVRDPKRSFISFLQYKRRQESWNGHRNGAEIAVHMRRIYETMLKLAIRKPGVIIDYADLKTDFEGAIARILHHLWQDETHQADSRPLIHQIAQATARETRQATGTPFLGHQSSEHLDLDDDDRLFFAEQADEIHRCYEAYTALLNLRTEG